MFTRIGPQPCTSGPDYQGDNYFYYLCEVIIILRLTRELFIGCSVAPRDRVSLPMRVNLKRLELFQFSLLNTVKIRRTAVPSGGQLPPRNRGGKVPFLRAGTLFLMPNH